MSPELKFSNGRPTDAITTPSCPACGETVRQGWDYCPHCGVEL
jgi:uncharacterized OB-fold protein